MTVKTFEAQQGEKIVVEAFPDFVAIDIIRETSEEAGPGKMIASNVDNSTATDLALEILRAAGGTLTDLGTGPATVTVVPDDATDDEVFDLWLARLDPAISATAEGSPLREVLVGLGLGFVLDQSAEAKAVLRALVGA